MSAVDAIFLAAWWERRREVYPRYRMVRASGPGSVSVDFGNRAPALRGWFESACGAWVVQLDGKRLALHWRRTEESAAYPRFASQPGGVRDRMVEEWGLLQKFFRERDIAVPAEGAVVVFKVDELKRNLHWKDEADACELLPVLAQQPLWQSGDQVDELNLGVAVRPSEEDGCARRWTLKRTVATQQDVLRLETWASRRVREPFPCDEALEACNAHVNALFAELVPEAARRGRFLGD